MTKCVSPWPHWLIGCKTPIYLLTYIGFMYRLAKFRLTMRVRVLKASSGLKGWSSPCSSLGICCWGVVMWRGTRGQSQPMWDRQDWTVGTGAIPPWLQPPEMTQEGLKLSWHWKVLCLFWCLWTASLMIWKRTWMIWSGFSVFCFIVVYIQIVGQRA